MITKGEVKTEVSVAEETPKIAAGGLSEIINDCDLVSPEEQKQVEEGAISLDITLSAESMTEEDFAEEKLEGLTDEEKQRKEEKKKEVDAIKELAGIKSTDSQASGTEEKGNRKIGLLLDLNLFKTTTQLTGDGAGTTSVEDIGASNTNVLEIAVPYNTVAKGLTVYRYHGGLASALKKLAAAPAKGTAQDGQFYLSGRYIHIFASGFSTYAIMEQEEEPETPGKTTPEKPTAPVLKEKTQTSITVEAVAGQEYSIDGGETWQISGAFTGLKEDTEYSIITKITATETSNESPVSDALVAKTDPKEDETKPTPESAHGRDG